MIFDVFTPILRLMMDDFQYLFRLHSAMHLRHKLKAGFAPWAQAQDKFRVCLLIAGGEKSSASIIRATCTFVAKIVFDSRFGILVTRCQQGS